MCATSALMLRPRDVEALRAVFRRFARVNEARVFGSRATGQARRASDLDLAVWAPDLSATEWADLREALDGAALIYELDVVRVDQLPVGPLLKRIESEGQTIHRN